MKRVTFAVCFFFLHFFIFFFWSFDAAGADIFCPLLFGVHARYVRTRGGGLTMRFFSRFCPQNTEG